MKKFWILMIGIVTGLSACNDINGQDYQLSLNKGKKWRVNKEMKVYIDNMESELNLFQKNEEKNYNELSGKLKENITKLISGCSMTGKAHDELHKWLIPFINSVNALVDSRDEVRKNEQVEKLHEQMKVFREYFE